MSDVRSTYLMVIGLLVLVFCVHMSGNGYWERLQDIHLSERSINILMLMCYCAGIAMLVVGLYSKPRKA